MKTKSLKPLGPRIGQGGTDSSPKPGDFPLGSSESRAAARAMLQRETAVTPYDGDCLILHSCCIHLSGHAKPGSHWLESTPFYIRGREVSDALYGPIIPCHLDPEYPHRTMASIHFEATHGRVPKPGEVLRYEELAVMYGSEVMKAEVERIQRAWAGRLPETPCPFRYEDGKMLVHQDDESWKAEEGAAYPQRQLHVIVDNLNIHKPKRDRWLRQHPQVHLHFTPTHASWLNQVEVWFSLLARQALRGGSFTSVQQLRDAIDAFIAVHNPQAAPFEWTKGEVRSVEPKHKYAYLTH